MKKNISPEISKWYSDLGKKGNAALIEKYGKGYHKRIRAMQTKPSNYAVFFGQKMKEGYTAKEIGKMWQDQKNHE